MECSKDDIRNEVAKSTGAKDGIASLTNVRAIFELRYASFTAIILLSQEPFARVSLRAVMVGLASEWTSKDNP